MSFSQSSKVVRADFGQNGGGLPMYPHAVGKRLKTHTWFKFEFLDFLHRDFRRKADKDVLGIAVEFWALCQMQDPVGTLPVSHMDLAELVGVGPSQWERLMSKPITPLDGWTPCLDSTGRERLMHPDMKALADAAFLSRVKALDTKEGERERARMRSWPERLKAVGVPQGFYDDQAQLVDFDGFYQEHFSGLSRTLKRVKRAVEAFTLMREGYDWRHLID